MIDKYRVPRASGVLGGPHIQLSEARMKLIVQGKRMAVPPGLREHLLSHLVATLTRFYDNEAAVLRVQVGDVNGPKGGSDKECHLTFRMPGTRAIQIEERRGDCQSALDLAGDRLIRVIKRELGRMRKPGARVAYRPVGNALARVRPPESPEETGGLAPE